METPDEMTKRSADDALSAKSQAISLGYFNDPFTSAMLTKSHGAMTKSMRKRPPIINRGYYARVEVIRMRFDKFLETHGASRVQVINVGSGFDTLSLQMLTQRERTGHDLVIYEIDFADVMRQKAQHILSDPVLYAPLFPRSTIDTADTSHSSCLASSTAGAVGTSTAELPAVPSFAAPVGHTFLSVPPSGNGGSAVPQRPVWYGSGNTIYTGLGAGSSSSSDSDVSTSSLRLKLLGCDLRHARDVTRTLLAAGFDPSVPTIIISECTLVYMESKYAKQLCTGIGDILLASTPAAWISYDMTHSQDTYGRVMLRNLSSAGYHIPIFTQLPTLDAYTKLFEEAGWGAPSAKIDAASAGAGAAMASVSEGVNDEEEDEDEDDDVVARRLRAKGGNGIRTDGSDEAYGSREGALHGIASGACTGTATDTAGQHSSGSVECITMLQAWDTLVSPAEKRRVSKLEIFDEVEEWNMLMSHYCVTTATRNMTFS
jgi:hypothetical protein